MRSRAVKLRAQQSGAALMVMLAVIVLGASWWLVSALSTPVNRATLEADHNARVLSQAKSALLGYLAHRALMAAEDHPGRLPCPESPGAQNNHDGTDYMVDDDGRAAGSCTLPAVGRLPWRTLGLDKLVDAAGEPLWYVVSPGWAFASPSPPPARPVINSNTAGQLTLDGQSVVALMIAPGKAFNVAAAGACTAHPQRRGRQPNVAWNVLDFLECDNASAITAADAASFVSIGPRDSFNDQVIGVTAKEIWMHVEGPVASRIQRDVVPQLEGVYASAQWGASSTNPIFPYAANFGAFTDAATFAFKGDAARTEGLLPMTFGQCVAGSDPRCDPSFVHWAINDPDQTANPNPSVVKRVFGTTTANVTSYDCVSTSSAQVVNCSIDYSRSCGGGLNLGYVLGGACYVDLEVSVLARGQNVGRALRTFATAGIAVSELPWSLVSSATPINGAGSAAADIRVQLPPASCACPALICLLFPCTASKTVTVTVPITVFVDHPLLNPAAGTAWRWYTANNWHHVTYYAIAPSHAPSGATHDCTVAGPCLSVTNGTPPTNVKALLVLAGRSLTGSARPNANLSDFLDTAENQNLNVLFEQKRVEANFNDRVVTVSNY
jgi:hypothetical protein